jgi:hypothetical protein
MLPQLPVPTSLEEASLRPNSISTEAVGRFLQQENTAPYFRHAVTQWAVVTLGYVSAHEEQAVHTLRLLQWCLERDVTVPGGVLHAPFKFAVAARAVEAVCRLLPTFSHSIDVVCRCLDYCGAVMKTSANRVAVGRPVLFATMNLVRTRCDAMGPAVTHKCLGLLNTLLDRGDFGGEPPKIRKLAVLWTLQNLSVVCEALKSALVYVDVARDAVTLFRVVLMAHASLVKACATGQGRAPTPDFQVLASQDLPLWILPRLAQVAQAHSRDTALGEACIELAQNMTAVCRVAANPAAITNITVLATACLSGHGTACPDTVAVPALRVLLKLACAPAALPVAVQAWRHVVWVLRLHQQHPTIALNAVCFFVAATEGFIVDDSLETVLALPDSVTDMGCVVEDLARVAAVHGADVEIAQAVCRAMRALCRLPGVWPLLCGTVLPAVSGLAHFHWSDTGVVTAALAMAQLAANRADCVPGVVSLLGVVLERPCGGFDTPKCAEAVVATLQTVVGHPEGVAALAVPDFRLGDRLVEGLTHMPGLTSVVFGVGRICTTVGLTHAAVVGAVLAPLAALLEGFYAKEPHRAGPECGVCALARACLALAQMCRNAPGVAAHVTAIRSWADKTARCDRPPGVESECCAGRSWGTVFHSQLASDPAGVDFALALATNGTCGV